MRTIRLTLEYDGTRYAGWQRQAAAPTVQAAVESAVAQPQPATYDTGGGFDRALLL